MRFRVARYVLILIFGLSGTALAAEESWKETRRVYVEMRDAFRASYAKDLKDAHENSTRTHFYLNRLEYLEAFAFLYQAALLEGQRFRVSFLEFLQDDQQTSDDPITAIALFNRGIVHVSGAQTALTRFSTILDEMAEVELTFSNACSEEFLRWPRDYYNAQTSFAPPYVSITRHPNFAFDLQVGVQWSMNFGGGQPNSTKWDGSIDLLPQSEQEQAIQGTIVATGCAVGSAFFPAVGCGVGAGLAYLAHAIGKLAFHLIKQLPEVSAYNDTLALVDQVNSILADGTPTRDYSDQKVKDLCIQTFTHSQDRDVLIAEWRAAIEKLKEYSSVQTQMIQSMKSSQENRDRRVQALLTSQQAMARSAGFVVEGAQNMESTLEAFRRWNQRLRELNTELTSISEDKDKSPWELASRYKRDQLHVMEAQVLLTAGNESSFRQQADIESKPLYQTLKSLESRFDGDLMGDEK